MMPMRLRKQRAIVMSREERIERHAALLAKVQEHDARNWMGGFLRALDAPARPLAA
jgi:trehalose 6-phosphate synthase